MIHIERKKPGKQTLVVIILAALLAVLIAGTIIAKTVIEGLSGSDTGGTPPPTILDGEAIYNGMYRVAYPTMAASDIHDIVITSQKGKYSLTRNKDEKNSPFYISYTPEGSDEEVLYLPAVLGEELNYDYTSLYAKDNTNDYGFPRLYYIYSALTTLMIDDHVEIPEGEGRAAFLEDYGLDKEHAQKIAFSYKNADGELDYHEILIGNVTLTGSGYYLRVDGRDYVYVTTSNYFAYALAGAASLVNGTLVAAGLPADTFLEPYLTTSYKQWITHLYDGSCHPDGDHTAACKLNVSEGSTVIADADILTPINPAPDTPGDELLAYPADGYIRDGYSFMEFDLADYAKKSGYSVVLGALGGKGIGTYANEIIFTLISSARRVYIPEGEWLTYNYTVTEIEAIVTDTGDITVPGTPVGNAEKIRVSYTATSHGEFITPENYVYHAVLDLTSSDLSTEAKAQLSAATLGVQSTPIEINVTYDETSDVTVAKLYIEEIIGISSPDGQTVDKVREDSTVVYKYYYRVGNRKTDSVTTYIDLSKSGTDGIGAALLGLSVGKDIGKLAGEYSQYNEIMSDFYTVSVREIVGFIESELVTSFRFQNSDERDPFYGDSIYENTLSGANSIYGLNNDTVRTVLDILGGIGESTSSSSGFSGSETVAIGLNYNTMKTYHLYDSDAYRIYFELPRNIYDENANIKDAEPKYSWYGTLGFVLYISAEQLNEDGTKFRYVASDMYDVVTKVSAEKLVFLNYDFIDMWARRKFMMLDINDVEGFKVEFNMDDLNGVFDFDIDRKYVYSDDKGNVFTENEVKYLSDKELAALTELKTLGVWLTVGENSKGKLTETAFSKYLRDNGFSNNYNLASFYDYTLGGGKLATVRYESAAAAYFKEMMQMVYFTDYTDVIPPTLKLAVEEKIASGELEPLMSITIAVSDGKEHADDAETEAAATKYRYEFVRYSDRQVMVRISKLYAGTDVAEYTVSDFYVSTFALRKIVVAIESLLAGEEVISEINYGG